MAKSNESLRKFRSDIAALKKKGLIAGIDARSATPNRRLNKLLEKYDPVLSGKASAVKLSKKGIDEYKALGKPYEIAAPKGLPRRVIVPHDPGERVTVSHGKVSIQNPAGVKRTILPVKFENLPQYFNDLRKSKPKLKDGEYFAFRFFSNRSHKVFRSMDALVNYLEHYETVFDAIEENDAEGMSEIFQNLEIIRIDSPGDWKTRTPPKVTWKSSQHKQRKKKPTPKWKAEQQRQQNADRQRAFRQRMNASEKEKYDKAGRKRAKRSAKKRKAKKKK
jgi:hypothetical protein